MANLDLDFFEPIILHNCLRASDTSYISSVVDYLEPSHFVDVNIGAVVKIVNDYYIQRNSPPSLTEIKARLVTPALKESFKQAVGRIAQISKDPIDQFELIENTEVWLRERIMRACIAKIADAQVNGKPVDQTAVFTQMDLAQSISLIDGIGMDYFKDIDSHCQRLLDSAEYISTGWAWLDKMLGGGWMKFGRALYMFCGITNVGKSIFLGNIAVNALKQGKKVVLITLEMSEDIYGKRIDSQITQIPLSALGENTSQIAAGVKEFAAANPEAKLMVKEFPPSSITVRQIDAYLQKLVRKGIKIDLIVLDYLNLVAPQKTSGSSYDDIKKIAEQLRALTYKYAASVVSATQLNRSAYGVEDPGMETTSESIGLPQTVDAQFVIWSTDEDAQCSQINLGMMKNRFGPAVGSTKLHIDYQTLTLSDTRPVGQENALSGLLDKVGAITETEPVARRLEYDPGSTLVDAFLGSS